MKKNPPAAFPKRLRQLAHGLYRAHLAVDQLYGNERRFVVKRVAQRLRRYYPLAIHRQYGGVQPLALERAQGLEYRLMFGGAGNGVHLALLQQERAQCAVERKVVALGAGGGKNDFVGMRAYRIGDTFARLLQLFFSIHPILMQSAGVAVEPEQAHQLTPRACRKRGRRGGISVNAFLPKHILQSILFFMPVAIYYLQIATPYVALGALLISLIAVGYAIALKIRFRRLALGRNGSIEESLAILTRENKEQKEFRRELEKYLKLAEGRLRGSVQGIGGVRFNPFVSGQGGNQSFAAAFLDESGGVGGFAPVYSRDRVGVYAKPIESGTSTFQLSDVEKEAIAKAHAHIAQHKK